MKLYSTKNPDHLFSLKEAVMKGLPDDNGLFIPEKIIPLPTTFFDRLYELSFAELSYEIASHMFQ